MLGRFLVARITTAVTLATHRIAILPTVTSFQSSLSHSKAYSTHNTADRSASSKGYCFNPIGSWISQHSVPARQFCSSKLQKMTEEAMQDGSGDVVNGVEGKGYQRLPQIAKPTHYKINLKTHLDTFTFDGQVTIDVEIKKATNYLIFNAAKMDIKSVAIKIGRDVRDDLPFKLDVDAETMKVELNHELTPGPIQLKIIFTGTLNDNMHGFYRSAYTAADGSEKFMATTQFESTYARYAFPCWDEPIYKAKFDVSLTVPQDKTALSCMNEVKSEVVEEGWKKVTFDTTPLMSTYIMAFAVGEYSFVEDRTSTGVKVRVYTLPGKEEQGRFALEVGRKALEFYDSFFAIPYPLPKCDLIAIPDFSMGAMENWGLVTYREVYLLVDNAKTSVRAKSLIALVVGHELAHMWFGNLVTMKWWTDLWLKEGFATFMEYLFVANAYPEFNIWLHFANDEIARGQGLDALRSSHPIEVAIDNPNELEEIYDAVSYSKSASVIRMLFHFLGEDDLWSALSHTSQEKVAELMGEWTSRMGFPLISVSSIQDGPNRVLTLSQKRFIADGSPDEEGTVWQVPINVLTQGGGETVKQKILLKGKETAVKINGVGPDEWVKLNGGLTGYYRVLYSEEMLKQLIPAFRDGSLSVLDRFNLVTDLYAQVKSGDLPATQFLDLLEAGVDEENYNVWAELDSGVSSLRNVLGRLPSVRSRYDAFLRKSYSNIASKMGWDPKEGEGSQEALLRSLVLGRMGACGCEETKKVVVDRFLDHINNGKELSPDQRGMIYGLIGRLDGARGFENLQKLFETSDFSEVQRNCLSAMGNADDPELQKKCLEYATHGKKVRSGDLYLCFSSAASTLSGQDTTWAYFKDNYDIIVSKYGGVNSGMFQAIFKLSARNQASEEHAKEVEEFYKEKLAKDEKLSILDRPVKQTVENVRLNAGLLKRNGDLVDKWLTEKGY